MATRSPDVNRREHTLYLNPAHESQLHPQSLAPSRVLVRKSSDKPESCSNSNGIVTNDSNGHHRNHWAIAKRFNNLHVNHDQSYDTDGGIRTVRQTKRSIGQTKSNFEHIVSPRLPLRKLESSASKPIQPWTTVNSWSFKSHSTVNDFQNQHDNSNTRNDDSGSHRHPSTLSRVGGLGAQPNPHLTIRATPLPSISQSSTFRLIFLRHGERVNQVFGSDWFDHAFSNGTYHAFDHRLPIILPKRKFYQNFEFDVPLTGKTVVSYILAGSIHAFQYV